jgi:hypothetical protein
VFGRQPAQHSNCSHRPGAAARRTLAAPAGMARGKQGSLALVAALALLLGSALQASAQGGPGRGAAGCSLAAVLQLAGRPPLPCQGCHPCLFATAGTTGRLAAALGGQAAPPASPARTGGASPASSACSGQVVISELMISNKQSVRDEDKDSPDWLELYNRGTAAVSLSVRGWRRYAAGGLGRWLPVSPPADAFSRRLSANEMLTS